MKRKSKSRKAADDSTGNVSNRKLTFMFQYYVGHVKVTSMYINLNRYIPLIINIHKCFSLLDDRFHKPNRVRNV